MFADTDGVVGTLYILELNQGRIRTNGLAETWPTLYHDTWVNQENTSEISKKHS